MASPANVQNDVSFEMRLLLLPTGQVLFTDGNPVSVQIYTPSGTPNSSWAPTITISPAQVSPGGANYLLTGTQFNGLSQAVGYGDDYQAATNYPLVRIINNSSGHVVYARTHGHSTMAVATGNTSVSTEFDVPGGIELGSSTLVVVANGIGSLPVSVSVVPLTATPTPTATSTPTPTATPTATAVSITNPAADSTVSATVAFSCADPAPDAIVGLYIDDVYVAAGSSPFTFSWDTTAASAGSHYLVCNGYVNGISNGSAAENVTVSNFTPTVSITNPVANSTVSATVPFSCSDTAPDAVVNLYIDDVYVAGGNSPFTFSWDTTAASNGSHYLVCNGYVNGGTNGSAAEDVTVSN